MKSFCSSSTRLKEKSIKIFILHIGIYYKNEKSISDSSKDRKIIFHGGIESIILTMVIEVTSLINSKIKDKNASFMLMKVTSLFP